MSVQENKTSGGEGQQFALRRTLKTRHMNMIAIGGAIGTGLFFASGNAISTAGPGGALVAYGVMGILVYLLMTGVGEMATFIPVSGSFETYATRFVDPALGYALGWNYWFSWAVTIAAEVVVGGMIMQFWLPGSPGTLWSILFLAILFGLNMLSAKAYGEGEFWFAGIKVFTIIFFIIIGVLMILGIMGGEAVGFKNFVLDGGEAGKAPFIGGIFAIVNTFLLAGFSFMGTEGIGIAAGESENPERDVPRAVRSVFWRILIFYIGAIVVIGCLIPFTDPNLLRYGAQDIAYSPFTIILQRSGIAFAASLMNAVVLTSVLSCGNSGLYAASRILYSMAKEGKAPKALAKVNRRGVPVYALIMTTAVAAVAFLGSLVGEGQIYIVLYSISGLTGFFAWLGIAICHLRFRKAYIAQGYKLEDLKYRAKWYPAGPIMAIVLCTIVIFGANIWIFQGESFRWIDVIINYAMIPIFIGFYLFFKITKKTKILKPTECNLSREQ
jgi:amino acid permease